MVPRHDPERVPRVVLETTLHSSGGRRSPRRRGGDPVLRLTGPRARYREVWYEEELPRDSDVDIVLYRQRQDPVGGAKVVPFLSMVTDLSVGADAIAGQFGKDCRYKIRRADARDALTMEFVTEPHTKLEEF